MQGPKEYWVKNRSHNALTSSELNLTVPVGKPVNLFALNPNLTHEMLANSEAVGFLHKTQADGRLAKLIEAPTKPSVVKAPVLTEFKGFMPSRRRSSIIIDVKEQNFVDELTSFDEAVAAGYDEDGFSDPIKDGVGSEERLTDDGGIAMPELEEKPRRQPAKHRKL